MIFSEVKGGDKCVDKWIQTSYILNLFNTNICTTSYFYWYLHIYKNGNSLFWLNILFLMWLFDYFSGASSSKDWSSQAQAANHHAATTFQRTRYFGWWLVSGWNERAAKAKEKARPKTSQDVFWAEVQGFSEIVDQIFI